MLEASNIECVRGERTLFSHVDFRLDGGELLDLQGGNGSGKTSLLRMICGLSAPANGEIRWRGELIGKLGEDYRRELCFLGHHNAIKEELTPLENLLASAKLADEILDAGEALDALEIVGLAGREDLACCYLSQGQKRRVELIAGLIGAHLQRGGLAVLTTHQTVNIVAGSVRQLRLN